MSPQVVVALHPARSARKSRPNADPTRVPSPASWCPQPCGSEYGVPAGAPVCTRVRRSGNAVYRETGIEGSNPSRSGFLYRIRDIASGIARNRNRTCGLAFQAASAALTWGFSASKGGEFRRAPSPLRRHHRDRARRCVRAGHTVEGPPSPAAGGGTSAGSWLTGAVYQRQA
jgi:hypothetical protein